MSYSAVVEALRFGHAQVGLMSAWPIAASAKLAGTDVVLSEVREVIIDGEKTNQTYYYSYYVVMKNSSYTKLEDLKGKRAVYASLTSTSGYLFPVAKLVEKGLISKPSQGKEADPGEFFGTVATPGGYGPAWDALKRGQADVGVIAGDVSEKLFREIQENTRIIETQGPIPSHGVVFSRSLEEPLRSELINAFMELNKPENNDLMRKLVSAIFVGFKKTSNEEHLAGLSAALNATGYKLTEKLG
jgi:phosphonate transport system substrate-binding protein